MSNFSSNNSVKVIQRNGISGTTSPGSPLPFNDIGPIPPPKMFSDLALTNCDSNFDNNQLDYMQDDVTNIDVPQQMSLPLCVVHSHYIEAASLIEEVPAKEPQLSAVPKKSALKKTKFGNDFTNSSVELNEKQQNINQNSTFNASYHSNESSNSVPATSSKPQVSPRYSNCSSSSTNQSIPPFGKSVLERVSGFQALVNRLL